MNKRFALFFNMAAASFLAASPLIAQTTVASRYARWESQLRSRVENLNVYPRAANGATGEVLVGFHIGADGTPTDISVQRSSGNPIFEEAAVRLVGKLGRIGPVPTANRDIDMIEVKLSYGDPSGSVAESMRLARQDRADQLAHQQRNRELVSSGTEVAQNNRQK